MNDMDGTSITGNRISNQAELAAEERATLDDNCGSVLKALERGFIRAKSNQFAIGAEKRRLLIKNYSASFKVRTVEIRTIEAHILRADGREQAIRTVLLTHELNIVEFHSMRSNQIHSSMREQPN